jgi:hypothetical protein
LKAQQENSPFGFFKKLAEEKTKEAKEALENMDLKDLKIPTDKTPGNKAQGKPASSQEDVQDAEWAPIDDAATDQTPAEKGTTEDAAAKKAAADTAAVEKAAAENADAEKAAAEKAAAEKADAEKAAGEKQAAVQKAAAEEEAAAEKKALEKEDAGVVVQDGGAAALEKEDDKGEHKMLELAAIIYALNTLFKVAVFSQFLEYGMGTTLRDMVAGFVAALICTTVLYPIDTLKTRMQLRSTGSDVSGAGSLYRGLLFGLLRECPSAALFCAIFRLVRNFAMTASWLPSEAFWASTIAATCASLAASIFRVPFETVNKQVQAGVPPEEAMESTFKGKGHKGLLGASWTAVQSREIPFASLQIALFVYLQAPVAALLGASAPFLAQRLLCGAVAGALAAFLTTPFDVLTTKVMTTVEPSHSEGPAKHIVGMFRNLIRAARDIWNQNGILGFWAGCGVRMLWAAPATCLFFYVVEGVRLAL